MHMLPPSLFPVFRCLAHPYRLAAVALGLSITALTIATTHEPARRFTSAAGPAEQPVLRTTYQLSTIPANGTGP